jgi:hypothetical protein
MAHEKQGTHPQVGQYPPLLQARKRPHHIHDGETGEVTPGKPINIFAVLEEITKNIAK